jgi:hypothetical protein
MKQPPKYINNLLDRRMKLANELIKVCSEIDDYCKRIEVDTISSDACILSHVAIYCEPSTARDATENAIIEALNRKGK